MLRDARLVYESCGGSHEPCHFVALSDCDEACEKGEEESGQPAVGKPSGKRNIKIINRLDAKQRLLFCLP